MVRKKFMRHSVPFAVPLSTLKTPNGTENSLVHRCAARSSTVVALKPSAAGLETKKWSKGAPGARTLLGL